MKGTAARSSSRSAHRRPARRRAARGQAPSSGARRPPNGPDTVAGVQITHGDRVVYPAQGVTKLALALFYESVAEWILPHLEGRPCAFVRCPEGLRRACFFQKHASGWAPEALRRARIREKTKTDEYLIVDNLAGLISVIQMGILEIHTWNSRVDHLEQPDRLVFDLDPGQGVPWTEVIEAARQVRETLEGHSLTSFVKTTGGKGLHVVVPLVPGAGWGACASFARAIGTAMETQDPARFVATMAKAKRKGKIFIDYLRNTRGATSVAAYSTRARSGAPVSTPLAWDELDPGIRSDHYTIANLRHRLESMKTDPWASYARLRQRLPAGRR
jgi:bifunctional non-homologous end joining protein LigD